MDKKTTTETELRLNWSELAEKLSKTPIFKLAEGQHLVIHQIDPADFLLAVEEDDPSKRLGLFVDIMKRYSLELFFEGSLQLGPFNLKDYSWTMYPGDTGALIIKTKPLTVRKSLPELISFLSKLPVNQALILKPFQDLFIEDLSTKDMFNYYQFCQDEQDPVLREKEQDALFLRHSTLLGEKNLLLKIYGMNVKQIDRSIDTNAGGMLFKPLGNEEFPAPTLVLGLVESKE